MKIKLYTDGASRGNPGLSGAGGVAYDSQGNKIMEVMHYLGNDKTNNQAEYAAVWAGINALATRYSGADLECYMDSQLVCRQLSGEYKVKNRDLRQAVEAISLLLNKFNAVSYYHVLREKNKEADALANRAVDERLQTAIFY